MAPITSAVASSSSSKRAARSDSHDSSDDSTPSSSSKKPRLTSEDPSNGNSHLVKSEKHHFSDGNIVLQAEQIEFRVHRGLFDDSSVFRDMLLVGTGNGNVESLDKDEDLPVVRLDDQASVWEWALKAVYRGFDFAKSSPSGKDLLALMILCEKYSLDTIFQHCRTVVQEKFFAPILEKFNAPLSRSKPDLGVAIPSIECIKTAYVVASRFPGDKGILSQIFYLLAASPSVDQGTFVKSEKWANGLEVQDVLRVHRIHPPERAHLPVRL